MAQAPLEDRQYALHCGASNCQILMPVRPDLWCRACLIEEVQLLKAAFREGRRYDVADHLHP